MEGEVVGASERRGRRQFAFDFAYLRLGGLFEDEIGRVEVDDGGVAVGIVFAAGAFAGPTVPITTAFR